MSEINKSKLEQATTEEKALGILLKKSFPDGREAHLEAQLFNWRLAVGPKGKKWYDDQW
jgi:hypothetical protein